jgi:hypothetical protein
MASRTLDIERLAADDLEYNYDVAGLAALRRRLTAAINNYKGSHAQYEEVRRQWGMQRGSGLMATCHLASISREACGRRLQRLVCFCGGTSSTTRPCRRCARG